MHVTARRTGGPLRCEIKVGRHVVTTDEPQSLGGGDLAATPHELLPAALAGCVATMIELYARRKGWALGEVRVDVDYDPEAPIRRFEVHVRVPALLTVEQRARLRRVAETCPVRRALTADVAVEHHFVDGAVEDHFVGRAARRRLSSASSRTGVGVSEQRCASAVSRSA